MRVTAAVFLLLALVTAPSAGADFPSADGAPARLELGAEVWFVNGNQVLSGGPIYARNRFEIDHPVDGPLVSVVAEARLRGPWRLRAAVGRSRWDTGTMTDTDWDGGGRLWFLSTSTSDGNTLTAEADLFFRLLQNAAGSYLDLAVGYHYLENNASFRDAHLLIENYVPISLETTGVWNENETFLNGFRLGLRAAWLLRPSLSISGCAGYLPYLWGRYRATRYAGLPYEQLESADPTGHGLELAAAVSWRPHPRTNLELGYRYLSWRAEGEENPGSSFFGIHNHFAVDMSGVFVRVLVGF
jgi:hypothetical protein